MSEAATKAATQVRRLLRRAGPATLSTHLARDGSAHPYGSLVLTCLDHAARPLLLLSDLAEHARNIAADPRVSLLVADGAGFDDPLEGPRVTLLGRAERCQAPRLLTRFVARHPGAARYAGFGDFQLYRLRPERAHLVAGFGRIRWLEAGDFQLAPPSPAAAEVLCEAEPAIVAWVNEGQAEVPGLIARHLLGLEGEGWRLVGVDPEGLDLRAGGRLARCDFPEIVWDSGDCRAMVAALSREACRAAGRAA